MTNTTGSKPGLTTEANTDHRMSTSRKSNGKRYSARASLKQQGMGRSKPSAEFPKPERVGERDWGDELLLALAPKQWTLKLISMREGARGGLQYHRLKDEGGVMTSGEMLVRYDDGSGRLVERVLRVGDAFRFPPGAVHQAEALTHCSYVEVSSPHFNDRVHVENEYGIDGEDGGLPSTEFSEIEIR